MSWQEYVDDHLMCELPNGGILKSAAIVGSDGGVWAQSPDFPTLSNDEVRALKILSSAPSSQNPFCAATTTIADPTTPRSQEAGLRLGSPTESKNGIVEYL